MLVCFTKHTTILFSIIVLTSQRLSPPPTFALTVAGGDCVAICDAGGPPSGGSARVAGQWTYDAYGNVLSTDHIHAHAYSRVGHKGLIFDRLDVGVADRGDDGSFTQGQFVGHASCGFDTPRIVPFAKGLYHNRNRVYVPEHGRFAQADPNASGQTLLDLPVYHGKVVFSTVNYFDVGFRYADSGSLYCYLKNRPMSASDPMGLFGFFDLLPATTTTVGLQSQYVDGVLDTGASIFATAMATLYGHSYDSMFDAEWAMDWSRSDDDYSRHGGYIDVSPSDDASASMLTQYTLAELPGLARGVRRAFDLHHIVTKYKSTGARTVAMLGRHGLNKHQIDAFIKSASNLIEVPRLKHGPGRHKSAYHDMIREFIDSSLVIGVRKR